MQSVSVTPTFPELLRVRGPRGLAQALSLGARFRNTSRSEYVRQTLLRGLAEDGVHLRDGQIVPQEGCGQ